MMPPEKTRKFAELMPEALWAGWTYGMMFLVPSSGVPAFLDFFKDVDGFERIFS